MLDRYESLINAESDEANLPHLNEDSGRLLDLANHLRANVQSRLADFAAKGIDVEVFGPDWCRENSTQAGEMHASVIVDTYGTTYALPNKNPKANKEALEAGTLDLYLMSLDGELTGTTCLVDCENGKAELGRSASKGKSGNTIIQDLRILDWLYEKPEDTKYHTLFTTLRNAPDRTIDDVDGDFIMRGGQAVTAHWKKFPHLVVNGVAPLYLKHGFLEQFTCASISRNIHTPGKQLYVASAVGSALVKAWHSQYELPVPQLSDVSDAASDDASALFEAHYPPAASGLTNLVHADLQMSPNDTGKQLEDCIEEVEDAGSPFTQIVLPIDSDTRQMQKYLDKNGFTIFGYEEATNNNPASLLYGKVLPGVKVVETHWDAQSAPNPFWTNDVLNNLGRAIAQRW